MGFVEVSETDQLQRLAGAAVDLVGGQTPVVEAGSDFVEHSVAEQLHLRTLPDCGDQTGALGGRDVGNIAPIDQTLARPLGVGAGVERADDGEYEC